MSKSDPVVSEAAFEAALQAGRGGRELRAESVRYDRTADAIELRLETGMAVAIPRRSVAELADLAPEALEDLTLSPAGTGLALEAADVHLSVAGVIAMQLTEDVFQFAWARRGGRSTSRAKAQAARRNGRLGGRPKRAVPIE